MAHFAKLGANGKVIQVLTLNNSDMLNADGVEDESVGQQYLETHNNWPAQMWIQTSYNTRGGQHYDPLTGEQDGQPALRKNFAGKGFTYDAERDAFIPPQPFASWLLNEDSCLWNAPVPYPDDGGLYQWDEDSLSWISNDPV